MPLPRMRLLPAYRLNTIILRLLLELWDSTYTLVWLFGSLYIGFPGGPRRYWNITVHGPRAPFFHNPAYILQFLLVIVGLQSFVARMMWLRYRDRQSQLASPWKDIRMSYVIDLLSPVSPSRALHFVGGRFGRNGRQMSCAQPWRLRHTILTLSVMSFVWNLTKSGGLAILLVSSEVCIWHETAWLLFRQCSAAFGHHASSVWPRLEYQNRPYLALAAVTQGFGFVMAIALMLSDSLWAIVVSLIIIPITSFGTLLLFLTQGNCTEFVNSDLTIYGRNDGVLCAICKAAMAAPRPKVYGQGTPHHKTRKSLQNSARAGCRVCATVWQHAASIPEDFVNIVKFWAPFTQLRDRSSCTVTCNGVDTAFDFRGKHVPDRHDRSHRGLDIRQRVAQKKLPQHTGSTESLSLATKWFRNCTIFHGTCTREYDATFRPSRLLYLEDHRVCLHTVHEMPERVEYFTLSHCWGRHPLVRLVEAQLDNFRADLPWNMLPKTFQDAIVITRQLGMSYLWIDSLCIIQDSEADWDYESKRMGLIYLNSSCNIAASDAPDSTHGCLHLRNPRTIQPEAVDWGSREEEQIVINRTDVYDNHILYTRAWVLQEALLARRTLDCGKGQLFWRCSELRASEVFPTGVPTNIYHDDHPAAKFKAISADNDQVILNAGILNQRLGSWKTRSQIPRQPGKGSVERYTDAPFAFWAAIVTNYTKLSLTKEEDRERAIAGITDVFRPHFGEHWFGMWRVFMPLELLWTAWGVVQHPPKTRSPTWSWFSVVASVSYVQCEFKYGHDVLVTQFVQEQRMGDHGMQLELLTPLLSARWTALSNTNGRRGSTWISSVEGETHWHKWRGINTFADDYGQIHFDHPDDVPGDDIFLMCIQIGKDRYKNRWDRAIGLVLHQVEPGSFERLGWFEDWSLKLVPFLQRTAKVKICLI